MKTNWDLYIEEIKLNNAELKKCIEIEDQIDNIITIITKQRLKNNITIEELSKLTNIRKYRLKRIECFKTVPRLDEVVKLLYELKSGLEIIKM